MSLLNEAIANHYMRNDESSIKRVSRVLSVRVDVDVLARVDFMAKKLGLNRSQMTQLLLDEGSHEALCELARLETPEGQEPTKALSSFYNEIILMEVAEEVAEESQ